MQLDKMLCLVPGNAVVFNMPVAGINEGEKNFVPFLEKEKNDMEKAPK